MGSAQMEGTILSVAIGGNALKAIRNLYLKVNP